MVIWESPAETRRRNSGDARPRLRTHGLQWDTMHWGHAVSPDLAHWTQRPIALEPGVHPGNLFSGGGVVDTANTSGLRTGERALIVVFTGTDGVSVAYSNDGG
jgi:fructan beta-fructosidase